MHAQKMCRCGTGRRIHIYTACVGMLHVCIHVYISDCFMCVYMYTFQTYTHAQVMCVDVAPGGEYIATASYDRKSTCTVENHK
jgi:hypothetical protein